MNMLALIISEGLRYINSVIIGDESYDKSMKFVVGFANYETNLMVSCMDERTLYLFLIINVWFRIVIW